MKQNVYEINVSGCATRLRTESQGETLVASDFLPFSLFMTEGNSCHRDQKCGERLVLFVHKADAGVELCDYLGKWLEWKGGQQYSLPHE